MTLAARAEAVGRGRPELVDLSHPVWPGMPLWPGTPGPEFRDLAAIPSDGYAERQMVMSTHTGTHIDAPAHLLADGLSIDRIDIGRFFGPAVLVDVRSASPPSRGIGLDQLRSHAPRLADTDFLLLRTGWERFWGLPEYDEGFPVLDDEAACWLAGLGLKGVGLDCPSFDPADSHSYPVHRSLLSAGVLLIENMANLGALPVVAGFSLALFPLACRGADAAPVRAVALL